MTDKPKRAGTMSDDARATIGKPHRTTPGGIPVQIPDEITGNFEGEELLVMRKKRPTDKRLELLETFKDDIAKTVTEFRIETAKDLGEIRGELGKVSGQLEVLPELISVVKSSADRANQRETLTLTAQLDVAKAEQTAKVDVEKAEKLDTIDAKKSKRAFWMMIAGAVCGGGAIMKALTEWVW